MPNTITFDRPTYMKLKRAYNKARDENRESFTFEGHELLVSYAKYLIEYLEDRLHIPRKD